MGLNLNSVSIGRKPLGMGGAQMMRAIHPLTQSRFLTIAKRFLMVHHNVNELIWHAGKLCACTRAKQF